MKWTLPPNGIKCAILKVGKSINRKERRGEERRGEENPL